MEFIKESEDGGAKENVIFGSKLGWVVGGRISRDRSYDYPSGKCSFS